jgi:hypothetical protein
MTSIFNFSTVETVYEDTAYGWIYRFIETRGKGVMVKRTPAERRPLWSHGVIMQIYDQDVQKFVPACKSGTNLYFSGMTTALGVVEEIAIQEA